MDFFREANIMFKKAAGLGIVVALIIFFYQIAQGCVGRVLYVGSLNSIEENLLGELFVMLINERTGTTVQIRYFNNNEELYEAFKCEEEEKRVDIIVEDTADALKILQKDRLGDPDQEYALVKDLYDEKFDVVWLRPFAYKNSKDDGGPVVSAPLLRRDVLTNFPLLPRILNKLVRTIDNEAYSDMTAKVKSGDKPKNVARDFLKANKLI